MPPSPGAGTLVLWPGYPSRSRTSSTSTGLATLAGSKINAEHPAATCDATVVARLRGAGAVLLGTLNMDEYAFGFTTENAHHGPTRNPHDPTRVAGGRRGLGGRRRGRAGALGPRLGHQWLDPSSRRALRVYGLKPTYGRLSRAGAALFGISFDHVGPLASSVGISPRPTT